VPIRSGSRVTSRVIPFFLWFLLSIAFPNLIWLISCLCSSLQMDGSAIADPRARHGRSPGVPVEALLPRLSTLPVCSWMPPLLLHVDNVVGRRVSRWRPLGRLHFSCQFRGGRRSTVMLLMVCTSRAELHADYISACPRLLARSSTPHCCRGDKESAAKAAEGRWHARIVGSPPTELWCRHRLHHRPRRRRKCMSRTNCRSWKAMSSTTS
jgi:hypothetical protein